MTKTATADLDTGPMFNAIKKAFVEECDRQRADIDSGHVLMLAAAIDGLASACADVVDDDGRALLRSVSNLLYAEDREKKRKYAEALKRTVDRVTEF